jgi:CheY-like chemotaxis protein
MSKNILVASPSKYRREWYRTELRIYGFEIVAVNGGTECLDTIETNPPDALILESSLRWGGADGVLSALNESGALRDIPVVLIAVDGVSVDVYQLARFRMQGFFNRVPFAEELAEVLNQAIHESSNSPSGLPNFAYQPIGTFIN